MKSLSARHVYQDTPSQQRPHWLEGSRKKVFRLHGGIRPTEAVASGHSKQSQSRSELNLLFLVACKKSPDSSHLAGRDDLQRPEGSLEVGSVGLEVVESSGDLRLQLGGVLPRRAVGSDLVERGRHGCGLWIVVNGVVVGQRKSCVAVAQLRSICLGCILPTHLEKLARDHKIAGMIKRDCVCRRLDHFVSLLSESD